MVFCGTDGSESCPKARPAAAWARITCCLGFLGLAFCYCQTRPSSRSWGGRCQTAIWHGESRNVLSLSVTHGGDACLLTELQRGPFPTPCSTTRWKHFPTEQERAFHLLASLLTSAVSSVPCHVQQQPWNVGPWVKLSLFKSLESPCLLGQTCGGCWHSLAFPFDRGLFTSPVVANTLVGLKRSLKHVALGSLHMINTSNIKKTENWEEESFYTLRSL